MRPKASDATPAGSSTRPWFSGSRARSAAPRRRSTSESRGAAESVSLGTARLSAAAAGVAAAFAPPGAAASSTRAMSVVMRGPPPRPDRPGPGLEARAHPEVERRGVAAADGHALEVPRTRRGGRRLREARGVDRAQQPVGHRHREGRVGALSGTLAELTLFLVALVALLARPGP